MTSLRRDDFQVDLWWSEYDVKFLHRQWFIGVAKGGVVLEPPQVQRGRSWARMLSSSWRPQKEDPTIKLEFVKIDNFHGVSSSIGGRRGPGKLRLLSDDFVHQMRLIAVLSGCEKNQSAAQVPIDCWNAVLEKWQDICNATGEDPTSVPIWWRVCIKFAYALSGANISFKDISMSELDGSWAEEIADAYERAGKPVPRVAPLPTNKPKEKPSSFKNFIATIANRNRAKDVSAFHKDLRSPMQSSSIPDVEAVREWLRRGGIDPDEPTVEMQWNDQTQIKTAAETLEGLGVTGGSIEDAQERLLVVRSLFGIFDTRYRAFKMMASERYRNAGELMLAYVTCLLAIEAEAARRRSFMRHLFFAVESIAEGASHGPLRLVAAIAGQLKKIPDNEGCLRFVKKRINVLAELQKWGDQFTFRIFQGDVPCSEIYRFICLGFKTRFGELFISGAEQRDQQCFSDCLLPCVARSTEDSFQESHNFPKAIWNNLPIRRVEDPSDYGRLLTPGAPCLLLGIGTLQQGRQAVEALIKDVYPGTLKYRIHDARRRRFGIAYGGISKYLVWYLSSDPNAAKQQVHSKPMIHLLAGVEQ
mmetsp:Transcript_10761/g.40407  ORF Transcript_10761/g.40407 Transcript_10761/m.40407 type:complete len:586 (-) Transcript_10761:549-2306(-)|eukprot:scaffold1433_cov178-Pinguiococcus_pyrenoidosus.AAC.3